MTSTSPDSMSIRSIRPPDQLSGGGWCGKLTPPMSMYLNEPPLFVT
jgi:hypothetical protein